MYCLFGRVNVSSRTYCTEITMVPKNTGTSFSKSARTPTSMQNSLKRWETQNMRLHGAFTILTNNQILGANSFCQTQRLSPDCSESASVIIKDTQDAQNRITSSFSAWKFICHMGPFFIIYSSCLYTVMI